MFECKEMIKPTFQYSGCLLGETENRIWKSPQAALVVVVEVVVVILKVECVCFTILHSLHTYHIVFFCIALDI